MYIRGIYPSFACDYSGYLNDGSGTAWSAIAQCTTASAGASILTNAARQPESPMAARPVDAAFTDFATTGVSTYLECSSFERRLTFRVYGLGGVGFAWRRLGVERQWSFDGRWRRELRDWDPPARRFRRRSDVERLRRANASRLHRSSRQARPGTSTRSPWIWRPPGSPLVATTSINRSHRDLLPGHGDHDQTGNCAANGGANSGFVQITANKGGTKNEAQP